MADIVGNVQSQIEISPHKSGVIADDQVRDCAELDALLSQLADPLRARECIAGDCVALVLPRSLAMVVGCPTAVLRTGHIAVPVNSRLQRDEIPDVIGDVGPVLVLTAVKVRSDIIADIASVCTVAEAMHATGAPDERVADGAENSPVTISMPRAPPAAADAPCGRRLNVILNLKAKWRRPVSAMTTHC
jgi:acyl-coenzyme A synthetase/AMP-(fatty) acid ligase